MHKILITLLFCLSITQGKADHFNTDNLFYACKQDTSFWGSCYSYLGGMPNDLVHVRPNEQEKLANSCNYVSFDARAFIGRGIFLINA